MDFPFQEPSKAFEDTQRASCGCAALSERQRVFAEQSLTGARKYPENEACSCKRNPSPIIYISFSRTLFFSHSFYQFRQLLIFSGHISIVFAFMWQLAVGAVFDPLLSDLKVPAAFFSQRIQWTVAEQAVEVLRVCSFVTGKIFALFVAEKRKMFSFPIWFFHDFYLHVFKLQFTGSILF